MCGPLISQKLVMAKLPVLNYTAYLASAHWQFVKRKALTHAGNRCQVCNGEDRLDVHHRTYVRIGCEWPADVTVLCHDCHELFHRHRKLKRRAA